MSGKGTETLAEDAQENLPIIFDRKSLLHGRMYFLHREEVKQEVLESGKPRNSTKIGCFKSNFHESTHRKVLNI